ncbi:hypothetical protein FOZ60_012035 [Perkinsus olseni]|uniref:Integrase catalytic domain-containing protein n=1 Tax=Perkinsus olseni TaxID=32597 RepID=A0A7J6PBA8_PEROL|nr:hypothetical protein FOZ60_012035 [Perkinsus olseni]
MNLRVCWLPSSANVADRLTRVFPSWPSDTAIDDEDGITANVQRLPGNDFDNCDDICLLPRDHGPNVDPRGELSSAPSAKDDSSGGGEEDGGSPAQVLASAAVGTDITVFGQQPSVTLSDQLMDPILADINQLVHDRSLPTSQLPPAYARILPQINVRSDDGVLCRRVKVPPDDVVNVPLCPSQFTGRYLSWCHEAYGHPNWECMWRVLRKRTFWSGMAQDCRDFVDHCSQCAAATTTRRNPIAPTTGATAVTGDGPWSIVFADTISFNPTAHRTEAVLVMFDSFTKWIEVEFLQKNNGICVASGLRRAFLRWGPPQVLRIDSGPEMWNSTTRTLLDNYHVKVRRGTPRHPQSQGGVERAHRSLLLILRKLCDRYADSEHFERVFLEAVHYYRCRPTSTLGLSPMLCMCGWEDRTLSDADYSGYQWDVQTWSKMLQDRQARLCDYIDGVLSPQSPSVPSSPPQVAFMPGDSVMLLRSERRNKLLPPYERGYRVVQQMAPTMVRLAKPSSRRTMDAHISQVLPDTPQPTHSTDAITRPTGSSPLSATRDDDDDDDAHHEDDDDDDDDVYVILNSSYGVQDGDVQSPGDVESPLLSADSSSSSSSSSSRTSGGFLSPDDSNSERSALSSQPPTPRDVGGHSLRPRAVLRPPERYMQQEEE